MPADAGPAAEPTASADINPETDTDTVIEAERTICGAPVSSST